MATPLEIIVGPLSVYLAPVGEAMPAVDAAPSGNWALMGTSGTKNYSEDGVTLTHGQSVEQIRTAGSTGPIKAVRTEESLVVEVTVYDLTMEEYTRAINNVTPTEVAAGVGTVGTRAINLRRGSIVAEFAVLLRGEAASPELASVAAQYEIPRAYVDGEPELIFAKGEPAGIMFEFHALEDPAQATDAERFGQFIYEDAAALP